MMGKAPTTLDKLIVLFSLVGFVIIALWPMPIWDKVLFLILLTAVGATLFEVQGRLA